MSHSNDGDIGDLAANSPTVVHTEAHARAAQCWFDVDRVPGDPTATEWKRRARLRQAQWRDLQGLPMGRQPYDGGADATPVGSRLDLDFARSSQANFLTPGARAAVRTRLDTPEKFQMLNEQRLWADLLSSMPLCFNLFGDLAESGEAAARAVHAWWPDAPTGTTKVLFEHSPGRSDEAYLGNRTAFDVAFRIDSGGPASAIIGVETKYHEHVIKEAALRTEALPARYVQVTEQSGVFVDDWRERIGKANLQQIWLDHLLILSMLQHPSGQWTWGKFVLAYPSENPSFERAADMYRRVLRDEATFEARTIESLIEQDGALSPQTVALLRKRYF